MKGRIVINPELCKECLLCVNTCPKNNIIPTKDINSKGYHPVAFTNNGTCTGCALCAYVCPEIAIEVWRA
ncbi:MAG: 4Fe-4S binding protein [Syntrophales bacterium]|nr:4Fe-4S binding protein [Syntrophales bacterium]